MLDRKIITLIDEINMIEIYNQSYKPHRKLKSNLINSILEKLMSFFNINNDCQLIFISKELFDIIPERLKCENDFYIFEKFDDSEQMFITYKPYVSIDSEKMLGSVPKNFIAETIHTLAHEYNSNGNVVILGMDKFLEILSISNLVILLKDETDLTMSKKKQLVLSLFRPSMSFKLHLHGDIFLKYYEERLED